MKKIIFSIYNDNVDQNNISTNSYKLDQFRKYSKQLEQAQREYAKKCDAEYVLHRLDITDYTDLQFQKIRQLELYAEDYDQILYLDFDVVPHKRAENIFDVYGDTLALHSSYEPIDPRDLKVFIERDTFDPQNRYCKAAAKKKLPEALSMIDKLSKNNIIHKNKAANLKSSLTKRVNSLK